MALHTVNTPPTMAQTLVRNCRSPLRYCSMRNMMGEKLYVNETTATPERSVNWPQHSSSYINVLGRPCSLKGVSARKCSVTENWLVTIRWAERNVYSVGTT